MRTGMTGEGLDAGHFALRDRTLVHSLTGSEELGAKTGACPSWAHMATTVKTPPGGEQTRQILEQIVRGERGRQLRAKVAALNADFDRSHVDDAFQAACERAAKSCRGQSEGEVYQWLYTTMMRELGATRKMLQREAPVDWSTESLARFRRSDVSVADEVVEREGEGALEDLTTKVLEEMTERQRAVAILYCHGLQRKEIAAHLDVTPRIVKRSLEQLLSNGRRRLIRLAGGGCATGEPLVARYAFGLGSDRDVQRARAHLATCPRCSAMCERLDFWREQVAATVPVPAVAGGHSHLAERLVHAGGDLVGGSGSRVADGPVAPRGHVASALAHVREQAAGLYTRAFDPTPLAGARPGTVATAIAGCIAVGSSAGYCVDQNVDLGSVTRMAGISARAHKHHEAKRHAPRVHAAQARVTTTTPTAAVVAPPPPTTTQTAPPPPTVQATPPPAPEDEFQPTSAAATASSTTATAASATAPKPKPAPANGAPEFGGP